MYQQLTQHHQRKTICLDLVQRANVAGEGSLRRRWGLVASQVKGRCVAGVHFFRHLRRYTAPVALLRRRSANFCTPATANAVTCNGKASHLRRKTVPPATGNGPNPGFVADKDGEVAGRGMKKRGTALEGLVTGHFASGSLIVAFHFLTRAKKQKALLENPCPEVGGNSSVITHA